MLRESLQQIITSLEFIIPEIILACSLLFIVLLGLFLRRRNINHWFILTGILVFGLSILFTIYNWQAVPIKLFQNMVEVSSFTNYFAILIDVGCILTLLISLSNQAIKIQNRPSEYVSLILSLALGAHLLVMSVNFIMVFISLELVSISSYILSGFGQSKSESEGSLKYFLFGSVAAAVMVYGFSILYGISGTLDFSSKEFVALIDVTTPIVPIAGLLVLAGYFYKIAAPPMHLWSPDVYQAAPTPITALFSTVPKLAGIGALAKFTLAINLFGQSTHNWQHVLAIIAMISMTIGNFSAIWQDNPKRLMAYSSIAQSGFLLIGLVTFSIEGIQFMMFYAAVYTAMNFLVFLVIQNMETSGVNSIQAYSGLGKREVFNSIVIFIGLISLAGIPPTGGFTAKLFLFLGVWEAYQVNNDSILLWLLVFGLLNTVVSLFFYLKIPYYSYLRGSRKEFKSEKSTFQNLLAILLVIAILTFFINPDLLMGWLNRINFVL
jgi:NADH-quinone oxidoreductase subunit N